MLRSGAAAGRHLRSRLPLPPPSLHLPSPRQGWKLTDSPDGADTWAFPPGVSLAPGQYAYIFCSGKARAPGRSFQSVLECKPRSGAVALAERCESRGHPLARPCDLPPSPDRTLPAAEPQQPLLAAAHLLQAVQPGRVHRPAEARRQLGAGAGVPRVRAPAGRALWGVGGQTGCASGDGGVLGSPPCAARQRA